MANELVISGGIVWHRPAEVPDTATFYAPTYRSPNGTDNIRDMTIQAVAAIIATQNARVQLNHANAERDWQINAPIYRQLGMAVPPEPVAPPVNVLWVDWATPDGQVKMRGDTSPVQTPAGAIVLANFPPIPFEFGAWVWEGPMNSLPAAKSQPAQIQNAPAIEAPTA